MSKNRLKKGFTIIELIVVIAVLGVLALLALPKFLDYTEKAKVEQVKSDIVAKEKFIDSKRAQNDDYIKDWEKVDVAKMNSLKNSLFTKKGLITESNNVAFGGEYYKIPKDSKLVKTSLKGDFYLGEGGEVYYYDENLAHKISGDGNSNNNGGNGGNSSNNGGNGGNSSNNGENDGSSDGDGNGGGNGEGENGQPPVTEPDTPKEPEPPVKPEHPTDKDLGYSDSDFTWIEDYNGYIGKNGKQGYFKYTGTGRSTVEIPHVIQGVPMTAYYKMFDEAPAEVTKVISTNKNVTSMRYMFYQSKATSLDVSELNTSKVTSMSYMFSSSQATSLDVSNFDTSEVMDMQGMFNRSKATSLDVSKFNTSKVKDMNYMFYKSQATSLDVSKFNTSKVENMSYMFAHSQVRILDLSSFDISKVEKMDGMFNNDSETTTVYARTQADVNRYSYSSSTPRGLKIIVGKPTIN